MLAERYAALRKPGPWWVSAGQLDGGEMVHAQIRELLGEVRRGQRRTADLEQRLQKTERADGGAANRIVRLEKALEESKALCASLKSRTAAAEEARHRAERSHHELVTAAETNKVKADTLEKKIDMLRNASDGAYARPSGDHVDGSWLCHILQEDVGSSPTPQKSSKTVFVSSSSVGAGIWAS